MTSVHLILFEDAQVHDLAPLTDLLPVPALAFGAGTLGDRWRRTTGAALVGLGVRPAARAAWRDAPRLAAPPARAERVLAVNAACLPGTGLETAAASALDTGARFVCDGRTVGAVAAFERFEKALAVPGAFATRLAALDLPDIEVAAAVVARPWDLMARNADALAHDLVRSPARIEGDVHERAVLYEASRIHVAKGARVDAFAVLDAREGPVHLDTGVVVEPHTRVKGPCIVGRGTHLLGGLVGRSTIGPDCRLAGEVEDCIWQGRANKRHHGFVGHSVIGEWVNLGALTTTSDLKNNYGPVRVQGPSGTSDTGLTKVGALVGAHAKTGIGTLLPTGAWVGTGANLFGGGAFAPKWVPAFGWWDGARMTEHRFDRFLETARTAMSRRGCRLEAAEEQALRGWFDATAAERGGDPVPGPSRAS